MTTERHYKQLMARSAGAQLLRAQGAHVFPQTPYADTRATDPYYSQGFHHLSSSSAQHPGQIGNRSDYLIHPDAQDIRAHLIAERRSGVPGALVDPNQFYDQSDARVLSGRPGTAEILPYPSPQRPGHYQSSAAAAALVGGTDLIRSRRAEFAAPYDHVSPGVRLGRISSLDDSLIHKDGLLSAGAYGSRRLAGSSYDSQEMAIPRITTAQHGILGAGGRQGRDLERYLMAVQPDKLVRYAATYLSPEPAIKRARYAMMANNVAPPPEVDVYSNYRQAKLRRSFVAEAQGRPDIRNNRPGSRAVDTWAASGGRKEREKEPARERRRRSDDRPDGNEKKSDTHGHENRNGSKNHEGSRLNQLLNSSQSSGGAGRSVGAKQDSKGPNRSPAHPERPQGIRDKEDVHVDSDKDSELGSLGADLSDFEVEEGQRDKSTNSKKKVSEEPEAVIDAPLDGMIFGCSSATFYECMRLQLFGLPIKNKDEVMRVAPGTKLFLFNFDTKELSGIFEAISHGSMMIQPDAFRGFGAFPAQVQVRCVEQCPNIHLGDFKPVIKENFTNAFKFKFTLNSTQVKDLVRLFRRTARAHHQQLHQRPQGGLLNRYVHESIPSEDYLLRNSPHRRQIYSQHHQARFGLSSISSASVIPLSTKSKVPESKGASRKARKGRRKKRKVDKECPESLKADNCSLHKQPEEMGEADVARNASNTRDDDGISKTNLAVIVREVIVTDSSSSFDQNKEIVETLDANASKGSEPSEPDHEISHSMPGEFPGLQSDHEGSDGKQVSFVEDSSNDGKCGLAGERSEGQGRGLNILKEAMDYNENVLTESLDSAPLSSGLHEGLRTKETVQPLRNIGSPPKMDASVTEEPQFVDKVETSQVVTPDEAMRIPNMDESVIEEPQFVDELETSQLVTPDDEEGEPRTEETVREEPQLIDKVETSHLLTPVHAICEPTTEESETEEPQCIDELEASQLVTLDDALAGKEAEETENLAFGCSANNCKSEILETLAEASLHGLVEHGEEEETSGTSENTIKTTEIKVGDTAINNVEVAESGRFDEKQETAEVDKDQLQNRSGCSEDLVQLPVSQSVDSYQISDREDQIYKLISPQAISEKDYLERYNLGTLICCTSSLAHESAATEELVDIDDDDDDDDLKFKFPKVEDGEKVTVTDGSAVLGGSAKCGHQEEVVKDTVDCKLPLEDDFDEEDAMDDGVSSEIPQTSENEDVLESANDVSSEVSEEGPDEDDEEVNMVALNIAAHVLPQLTGQGDAVLVEAVDGDVSFPISQVREDGDLVDIVGKAADDELRGLMQPSCHGGEKDDEFPNRCGCDDPESESEEDISDTNAETE